jgi:hypothetical protein
MNRGFFQYEQETKCQSTHWKSPRSPRKKKTQKSQLNFKAMMIVYFDIRGIVGIDCVPEGETVDQVFCKEVLTILCERVRRKSPEMWKRGSWILHHDTAPTQRTVYQDVSGRAQGPHVGTSILVTWPSFFISKERVCIKRNPFRVCRCSEGKGDGCHEEAVRKEAAKLHPTVENLHGAGVGRGPF